MTISQSIRGILWGIILIIIGVVVIIALVNMFKGDSNEPGSMSITEAQKKCTVMEAVDLEKYNDAGSDVWELASKHCFAEWDMSKNPENTEEKFIEIIKSDWEARKTEEIKGQTIEELYNEVKDTL